MSVPLSKLGIGAGQFRLEISYRERPFLPPMRWPPLPQLYFPSLPFVPKEVRRCRLFYLHRLYVASCMQRIKRDEIVSAQRRKK